MYDQALTVAIAAAQKAGKCITDGIDQMHDIQTKSDPVDRLTETDLEAQKVIVSDIEASFPDHGFLAEEDFTREGTGEGAAYRWVIDPVDGTSNFIQRLPFVGVSIALQENGESVVGVLHFPLLGTTYTAIKGDGALRDGKKVHVRDCSEMSKAFIAEIFSDRMHRGKDVLFPPCLAYRKFGSAVTSLGFLADGSVDGTALRCCRWDIAAAEVIIPEAGGKMTWQYDDPNDDRSVLTCIASTPGIHDAFVEIAMSQYDTMSQ